MGILAAALAAILLAGPTSPPLIHGSSGSAMFHNGRVDIQRTLDRLHDAHITTYLYELYRGHSLDQWEDLPIFLDDFGENPGAFPPDYAARMGKAARAQNPRFLFWPVFYYRDLVGKRATIGRFSPGTIDGVIFPFRDEPVYDTSVSKTAGAQILCVRGTLRPNQRLVVMVYASHYGRQVNKGNRDPGYVGAVAQDALALGKAHVDDGVVIYNLDLTGHDAKNALAADYDRVKDIYGSAS